MILILTDFEDFPRIHDMIWMRKERKKEKKKWHENSLLHPRDDNNYHFSDGLPFFSRWSKSAFKTECEENGGKRQIILKTQNCVEKSETSWEQQQHQEVRLRSDSTVWSEFAFGPVGHCFLCCNRFFPQ